MSEAESYIAKWLAREPGMELAQGFCPASERRTFALWGAVLNELDEAALDMSEAGVALAKLAWWGEDLAHGAYGAAQHPLLREFFALDVTGRVAAELWLALAQAAIAAVQDETPPASTTAALQRHHSYAEVLARIESTLFGIESASASIALHRVLRELRTAQPRWPLHLVARHQLTAEGDTASARGDYARELLEIARQLRGGSLFRRSTRALDALRLQHMAQGAGEPGRLRSLWRLWRAARSSAISA